MASIAVITARGGSKRIPRKNIRDFCGKPIIAYSIEAAFSSGVFDEVMVSTDDEEIKEVAKQYGAEVPFMRSEKSSDDYAATTDVLKEVLHEYQKRDRLFDFLCCIYPTAPFVTGRKLREAMQLLEATDVDSVVPVVPFSYPPQRGVLVRDKKLFYQYPEYQFARSQDLECIYHDAGQFYCMKVHQFRNSEQVIMKNTIPYILEETEVQDIDYMVDWELAELKFKLMKEKLR